MYIHTMIQVFHYISNSQVPVTRGGRFLTLPQGMSIHSLVSRVKTHLGLGYVRLALGDGRSVEDEVTTLAVCAGSGAAVLKGVPAQVFLTGSGPFLMTVVYG